jgi:hypothetical protein
MNHNPKFYSSGVHGSDPVEWWGKYALDGTVGNWKKAPVGSSYIYKPDEYSFTLYRKLLDNNLTSDWIIENGVLAQRFTVADFTDGGSTAGTLLLDGSIPVGVTVKRTYLRNVVGFAGDVSATFIVGSAGVDTDRYNTGTPSVFATADHVSVGAVSGTAYHAAAIQPTVTITTATDFGLTVTNGAGAATIFILFE